MNSIETPRSIFAADIGSTRCDRGVEPKFAWVRIDPKQPEDVLGSSDIRMFARVIADDLEQGLSVAVGFEAPLFVPVPSSADNLCRGRTGEGSRSFAAPAGLAVSTLGLHQAAWVLREVRHALSRDVRLMVDPTCWPPDGSEQILFCWEAFVSGAGHSDMHVRDAATAATSFLEHESHLASINAVVAESPLSLIAAAAIWSGWTDDVRLLHTPTLVVKPEAPYAGAIGSATGSSTGGASSGEQPIDVT